MSSLGHRLLFWCPFWSFGDTLKNPYFPHFWVTFGGSRGCPRSFWGARFGDFLSIWVNFLAREVPDNVSAPAGSQVELPK